MNINEGVFRHPYVDTVFSGEYSPRLSESTIRELQDQHNVNMCDGNDEAWFDGDNGATDENLTIIDDVEFFERYVD